MSENVKPPKQKIKNDSIVAVDSEEKTKGALVPVFSLDNLNPALLPELATFKEKQLKVVKDNPFIKITDTASRELAKKHRTARVSARTALQSQDKLISAKFNEAKTKAKTYIAELIEYTQPGEIEQQKEIDRDEAVLEAKRTEKARLEKERIDNIKKLMDDYVAEWKTAFNLMVFDTIEEVGAGFLESYTNYDLTVLEEFESLFPAKIEELTQYLLEKTDSLTESELARVEKERLAAESEKIAKEKAELAEKQKLAEEAEAKAKAEREQFEKEKREFEETKAKVAKKERFENRKQILLALGFTYDINREYNFSLEGVWSCFHEQIDDCTDEWFSEYLLDIKEAIEAKKAVKETPIETVATPETLVSEIPTANVCNREDQKQNIITPQESIKPLTWEDIIKEFTDSGAKSYSKWLIENYNVPTKIINP